MSWCEDQELFYCFGSARDDRLSEHLKEDLTAFQSRIFADGKDRMMLLKVLGRSSDAGKRAPALGDCSVDYEPKTGCRISWGCALRERQPTNPSFRAKS
jgi:hypothetical protein